MPRSQRRQVSSSSQVEMQETQRIILRTAFQLFMEHGYRGVSTRQIAESCGLTQPALYHYFSDKQDLYVAVMQEELAGTRAALERIARRSESVEERLKRVAYYLLSAVQHDLGMMFHDINNELSVEAQRTLMAEHRSAMIAPIASIFEQGIQQGLLRTPQQGGLDAMSSTHVFLSMLSKFLLRSKQPVSSGDAATCSSVDSASVDTVVRVLLYGLALPEHEVQQRQEDVVGKIQ